MEILWILLIVVAAVVLYLVMTYNKFVTLKTRIDEAWSQIEVQFKRRADLIPNLVETVKGYAAHEKQLFEKVTEARSAMLSAQTPQQASDADNMFKDTMKSLFAVAEAYPELKASQNFTKLQDELTHTEDKVAYSRQFYNSTVREYNVRVEMFPSSIVASMFNFKLREFFDAPEGAEEPVAVSFTSEQQQ